MASPIHNHSDLLGKLAGTLRSQFELSPQRFFQWKQRGVPYAFRAEVARIAGIHGVQVPDGFLNPPPSKQLERAEVAA